MTPLFNNQVVDTYTRDVISTVLHAIVERHPCTDFSCGHMQRVNCIDALMERFQEARRLDHSYNDMRRMVTDDSERDRPA